jgi:hypothetical protein
MGILSVGLWVQGFGYSLTVRIGSPRAPESGCRVEGLEFRVYGEGFRV